MTDFIDPTCSHPTLDATTFPIGSAGRSNGFNILPFLCQLMKAAVDQSVDPMLVPPAQYDMSKHLDFSALTGVGDSRFSTGAIMSAAFVKFLPRLITQIEVKNSGGTQIIDNYICDSDGNAIKESMTVPVMTTVTSKGANLYGYEIPAGLNTNDLLKPLNQQEVYDYINGFIQSQSENAADYFISYLELNYPSSNWSYSVGGFTLPPFFYVEVTNSKTNQYVYFKYHENVKDYVVGKLFDLGLIPSKNINYSPKPNFSNSALVAAYMSVVPDYKDLLNNKDASQTYLDKVSNTVTTSSPNEYKDQRQANTDKYNQLYNDFYALKTDFYAVKKKLQDKKEI